MKLFARSLFPMFTMLTLTLLMPLSGYSKGLQIFSSKTNQAIDAAVPVPTSSPIATPRNENTQRRTGGLTVYNHNTDSIAPEQKRAEAPVKQVSPIVEGRIIPITQPFNYGPNVSPIIKRDMEAMRQATISKMKKSP